MYLVRLILVWELCSLHTEEFDLQFATPDEHLLL
jgi:hypothetical protein